jgi:predicted dehydrogenase
MAPIRVGSMDISANTESWKDAGAGANTAHFPYLLQSPHYKIAALCNSSVEAAKLAIISAETRIYGNPEDLTADPDVDLVVCSVNLKKHYELVKPVLLKGKDIFVE